MKSKLNLRRRAALLLLALFCSLTSAWALEVTIGDGGTQTNRYLPFCSQNNYGWTQQIYTAAEIGTAGTIKSIAFKNTGPENTRNLSLYMVHTDKDSFTDDLVAVSAGDLVFSGNVTFTTDVWTTITLSKLFEYNGVDNLVVCVVDNSGYNSGSPYMSFLSFATPSLYQSLCSADADANLVNPGALLASKNQIKLDITQLSTLTVYDGETTTSKYVPAYIFYFDNFTRSQFVIPADELAGMEDCVINAIKFYTTSANVPYTTVSTVDVYLKEVGYTSISEFETKADCSTVYQGTLDIVSASGGGELTITFTTPFTYRGGNLLVGVENTTAAGYKEIKFCGEAVSGASVSGCNGSSLDDVPASQQDFIPKTTFYYSPAPAQGLTVYEGADPYEGQQGAQPNQFIPACIHYFDEYTRSQFVIPAADLASLTGSSISTIKFYTRDDGKSVPYPGTGKTAAPVDVYLKEVSYTKKTTFDYEPRDGATTVYHGTLSVVPGDGCGIMTINLSTPYEYGGGNLLIGIDNTETASYQVVSFMGTKVTHSAAITGHAKSKDLLNSNPGQTMEFIPQTTFVPTVIAPPAKPSNVEVSNLLAYSASISWDLPEDATGSVYQYKKASDTKWRTAVSTQSKSITINGLQHATAYQFRVKTLRDSSTSGWTTVTFTTSNTSTLTVYENAGNKNQKVPVYGGYANRYQKCEFVIPASELTDMYGGTISKMTFYMQDPAPAVWTGTFQIFLKEVSSTTISAFSGTTGATVVYTGTLDATGSTMDVEFSNSYAYSGGNLLVGVYLTTPGNYKPAYFKGKEVNYDACVQGYDGHALNSISASQQNFIPKTTFTYTPLDMLPPTDVAVNYTGGTTATVTWTGTAQSFDIKYNSTTKTNVTSPYSLTNLSNGTTYSVKVRGRVGNRLSAWSDEISFEATNKQVIGSGSETSGALPTHCYYKYSLTQQIYTAAEVGAAGIIESIDFKNASSKTDTRNLDIYMVSTEKSSFSGNSDWIAVSSGDLVFSGDVTFTAGAWTTITLDSPFEYNGSSNVAIIVDDNAGSYTSSLPFSVFSASNQALNIKSDVTNYDPTNLSYSGTRGAFKNQIRLAKGAAPAVLKPTGFAVSDITFESATLSWKENGTATQWQIGFFDNEGTFTGDITVDANPYTLTNLTPETTYRVKVRASDGGEESAWSGEISFTTPEDNPVPYNFVTYLSANGCYTEWSGTGESYNFRYRKGLDLGNPIFFDDFENGLGQWTVLQGDDGEIVSGQSECWYVYDGTNLSGYKAHSGSQVASSWSWNGIEYQANNYLVSPQITFGNTLRFWVCTNPYYPDAYEVLLSTTGNAIADFSVCKPLAKVPATGDWAEVTIDLSDYAGQTGYIAIHHVDYDGHYLFIDDFGIYNDAGLMYEYPIGSSNFTGLVELATNTVYEFQVQSVRGGKVSDWSDVQTFALLTLQDDADNNSQISNATGRLAHVTLTGHTFKKDGKYNMVCLPFDLTIADSPFADATIERLRYYDYNSTTQTLMLYFVDNDLTVIPAGYPFIVKWADGEDLTDQQFANVIMGGALNQNVKVTDFFQFIGNFAPMTLNGYKKLYVGSDKPLSWPATNVNIGAFRAYLKLLRDDVNQIIVEFGDGTQISVSSILGDTNGDADVTISDAVGVVNYILGNPSAGFNIVNANVNGDTNISITDAVGIVDIVNNSSTSAPKMAAPAADKKPEKILLETKTILPPEGSPTVKKERGTERELRILPHEGRSVAREDN